MSSKVERKLAAIMFTDIADFTALSAKDENKAQFFSRDVDYLFIKN